MKNTRITNSKGTTLFEILVGIFVIVFFVVLFGQLFAMWTQWQYDQVDTYDVGTIPVWLNPEAANAQANQRMVQAIEEQNRLLRLSIEQKK